MKLEEARNEVGNITDFCHSVCISCTANDWFCPTYCVELEKAYRMPFEKILKSYARNDGDIWKVVRYIKRYKET
jgi:hypothetical protein